MSGLLPNTFSNVIGVTIGIRDRWFFPRLALLRAALPRSNDKRFSKTFNAVPILLCREKFPIIP